MGGRCMLIALVILALAAPAAFAGRTEMVSVNSAGEQGNDFSGSGNCSADGRFVVFISTATNLVPGDTNGCADVFVRDRLRGVTERVSVSSSGGQANHRSYPAQISADGRYVVFGSYATNLVPNDTNGALDIFVHDRQTGVTERVSVTSSGEQADADSQLYLALATKINSDGRFVVFSSPSQNLASPLLGGRMNLFMRDRVAGTTECVSVDSSGNPLSGEVGGISADGRFVVFTASPSPITADDMPAVYLRDRLTGITQLVSVDGAGRKLSTSCDWPAISGDGSVVVFWSMDYDVGGGQLNAPSRIYARDLRTGKTEIVSAWPPEVEATYVYSSGYPSVSNDGRFVSFLGVPWRVAPNGYSGPFIADRVTGALEQIGTDSGELPNADLGYSYMSGGGRYLVFDAFASNLVPNDTNGTMDVFIYDRQTFDDVPVDSWAYNEIEACVKAGVWTPFAGARGWYDPSMPVTRDAMAVFVASAIAGGDENVPDGPTKPSFPDVPVGHWAYKYAEYAKAHGIVTGYRDGLYHPERTVDRGQMAIFIARAIAGGDAYVPRQVDRPVYFADLTSAIRPECYKYVEFLAQAGIVKGYPDHRYRPELTCTRDQIAVYVARAFELTM